MKTLLPQYRKMLNDKLVERIEKNSSYSLRAFAKFLALDSSALSQVLHGKRFLSEPRAKLLLDKLELSPEEQERFLASMAQARIQSGLKRMSAAQRTRVKTYEKSEIRKSLDLSSEIFKTIADWYHYAILELTRVKEFSEDPSWISQKLGISTAEATGAIDRLLTLQLLERADGKLVKCTAYLETANKSLSAPAFRKRQRQIIEKSLHSLESHPIAVRNHSARTVAIDVARIAEAKKRIEKFMIELCDELAGGEPAQVYELSVQLFPLQP